MMPREGAARTVEIDPRNPHVTAVPNDGSAW
jgi:hypothetical protein